MFYIGQTPNINQTQITMKKSIQLIIIALSILITSCKKETPIQSNSQDQYEVVDTFILMDSDTISFNPLDIEVVTDINQSQLVLNVLSDFTIGSNDMNLDLELEWSNFNGCGEYLFSNADQLFGSFDDGFVSNQIAGSTNKVVITSYDGSPNTTNGYCEISFIDGTKFFISFYQF